MPDNWKSYFCTVNFKLASIRVNLGLRDDRPSSKSWLLWVWLYFQSPRSDGLSHRDEAPKLWEIENALAANLSNLCGALLCGTITTEGRREFYFYGESATQFESVVTNTFQDFADYKHDQEAEEDPVWNQYLDVLYPSPEQLQRISNQDLLDYLLTQGDNPLIEREISHWIHFPTADKRESFKGAAACAGFTISYEYEDDESLFTLVVTRVQSLQQPKIDNTVIALFRLAQQFQGDYTGWETPLEAE